MCAFTMTKLVTSGKIFEINRWICLVGRVISYFNKLILTGIFVSFADE